MLPETFFLCDDELMAWLLRSQDVEQKKSGNYFFLEN